LLKKLIYKVIFAKVFCFSESNVFKMYTGIFYE